MQLNSLSQKQTVFIIDDNEAVRETIAALVDIRGLPVETFASGENFLAEYSGVAPGCVVTDLRMEHGMTGLDLQVALRERGFKLSSDCHLGLRQRVKRRSGNAQRCDHAAGTKLLIR